MFNNNNKKVKISNKWINNNNKVINYQIKMKNN